MIVRDALVVYGTDRPPQRLDVCFDHKIVAISPPNTMPTEGHRVVLANGRVLMPGFVDAHTHLCWAGDRLDEWAQLRAGRPYLELLAEGGGILSTVRATRAASTAHLASTLLDRLQHALHEGTTTVEVKSGYGLLPAEELRQLEAIERAAAGFAGTVVPTALLGHALLPDVPDLPEQVLDVLPEVASRWPGIAVDVYVETGAWSVAQGRRLLERAQALGLRLRAHVDQFNALGMLDVCIELGAVSVDHLEATEPAALRRLAASSTAGVFLPLSGLHTDGRHGDARTLRDAGGTVVVASNANPGSAPGTSMPLVVALAVRELGLTPEEALVACTSAAAGVLGLCDRGVVEVGYRADLVLLRHNDPRALAWWLGGDPVAHVFVAGQQLR